MKSPKRPAQIVLIGVLFMLAEAVSGQTLGGDNRVPGSGLATPIITVPACSEA